VFTIYIDDSGTSPEHKMAIAAGIIIPAIQIARFDAEWNEFLAREHISDFHSSVCLARNHKSEFANWDDDHVRRVFRQVRRMTFKYSVKGFCIGIHKELYDDVLPDDMRAAVGQSYYTWAVSSLLGLAYDWAHERSVPIMYVFDEENKNVKREIEDAMTFSERIYGDHFSGHHSFRKRREVPCLQAVDQFAWACFQGFRRARFDQNLHEIATESRTAYLKAKSGEWHEIQSLNREGLEKWVADLRNNPRTQEIIAFKEKLRESRKPKSKLSRQPYWSDPQK
jgi:hypothetical protein